MQRQLELHSDQGQVGFKGYARVDGKPLLTRRCPLARTQRDVMAGQALARSEVVAIWRLLGVKPDQRFEEGRVARPQGRS